MLEVCLGISGCAPGLKLVQKVAVNLRGVKLLSVQSSLALGCLICPSLES